MSPAYRIAVNAEWTSKCNAACPMCPRDAIGHPERMRPETWRRLLDRLSPEEVFRVVIAGYGEATTHPRFDEFVDAMRDHPVRFDMVSNGHLLDADKIARLDGVIDLLIVSFSSIDPDVYRRVHVKLDQRRVMANLQAAQRLFTKTRLAISLTPMPECLPTLPATIDWLKAQGIATLTMSPTLYNRAGNQQEHDLATEELRRIIRRHRLRSQELDFVPSVGEVARQWLGNRFKCTPRNVDLFVAANGDYLYCYNDIGHRHPIGNVATDPIAATLRRREAMAAIPSLCDGCDMKKRYGPAELLRGAIGHVRSRLQAA
jgi:MoaA/NifB/PqqE/SkfB family radical SAM enzyme